MRAGQRGPNFVDAGEPVCATARQVRVYVIPAADLLALLRGQVRISNLPSDGSFTGWHAAGNSIGIGIHSASFRPVAQGEQLPLVTAWLERVKAGAAPAAARSGRQDG